MFDLIYLLDDVKKVEYIKLLLCLCWFEGLIYFEMDGSGMDCKVCCVDVVSGSSEVFYDVWIVVVVFVGLFGIGEV